ncbi:hypothetical protein TorRG33x02_248350 [Trema orientale]|uniref:Uncharacterized protein n=1 Tax=Trema orientale TaxID=63057 RepID=A0A2P5DKI5_TREOI|nr:hypothetical protein TorRG33x02_248350 [Trema orientale]
MGKLGGNLCPNPYISTRRCIFGAPPRPLVNQPSSSPSASVQPLAPPPNDKVKKVSKDTSSSKKRKFEVVIPRSPLVLFGQGG